MTARTETLFEVLRSTGSIEDLGRVIDSIRDVYDLRHVAYHAFSLGRTYSLKSAPSGGRLAQGAGVWRRAGESVAAFSYGENWGLRYQEREFWRIDPVVEAATQSFLPIDWKQADWSARKRRDFLREAIDFGVGKQGYSIPIRGPEGQSALFTINADMNDEAWDQYISEFRSDFIVVSHFFHQKVLEIERVFGAPPAPKLSTREKDALSFLAAGKTRSQIAHVMNISENTLRVYLDSARHKLGALNTTHAVAIGMTKGIINV